MRSDEAEAAISEKSDECLMDSFEAAEFLGVSIWWLVKHRRDGTGPKYIKIGRAVRYSKADLLDFIRNNTRS
jgi:predicted DNA-binding transcriptional regulator AlpA